MGELSDLPKSWLQAIPQFLRRERGLRRLFMATAYGRGSSRKPIHGGEIDAAPTSTCLPARRAKPQSKSTCPTRIYSVWRVQRPRNQLDEQLHRRADRFGLHHRRYERPGRRMVPNPDRSARPADQSGAMPTPFRRQAVVLHLPLHEPPRIGVVEAARRPLFRMSTEVGTASGLCFTIPEPRRQSASRTGENQFAAVLDWWV